MIILGGYNDIVDILGVIKKLDYLGGGGVIKTGLFWKVTSIHFKPISLGQVT